MSDERKRLLDQATTIVADAPDDEPPRSDVIDAAFTHLIQSSENIDTVRDEYGPETIQAIGNTDVIALHYRTGIDSKWR